MAARLTAEVLGFVRRANAAGWTDGLIAEVVGVAQPHLCLVRRRLGLAPAWRGREAGAVHGARQRRFEAAFERLDDHEPLDPLTPADRAAAREEARRLRAGAWSLRPRAAEALVLRAHGASFAEVGRALGVSRERARQLCLRPGRRRR